MHKSDAYLMPSVFVMLLLGVLYFFINHGFYSFNYERVLMKPQFGPGAAKIVSYYGLEKLSDQRDAAVEYRAPDSGKLMVARVIAKPGQWVAVEEGKLKINNVVVEEPYLKGTGTRPDIVPMIVPRRHLFVLCDERGSRGASRFDSRSYGPIPFDCVTRIISVSADNWRNKKGS